MDLSAVPRRPGRAERIGGVRAEPGAPRGPDPADLTGRQGRRQPALDDPVDPAPGTSGPGGQTGRPRRRARDADRHHRTGRGPARGADPIRRERLAALLSTLSAEEVCTLQLGAGRLLSWTGLPPTPTRLPSRRRPNWPRLEPVRGRLTWPRVGVRERCSGAVVFCCAGAEEDLDSAAPGDRAGRLGSGRLASAPDVRVQGSPTPARVPASRSSSSIRR